MLIFCLLGGFGISRKAFFKFFASDPMKDKNFLLEYTITIYTNAYIHIYIYMYFFNIRK